MGIGEDVARQKMPGHFQSLQNIRRFPFARAEQKGRKRKQLVVVGRACLARYGTACARADLSQIFYPAADGALAQVKPIAQSLQ